MNRLAILLAFPAALFLASPSIAQDRIAPKEETKEELKKKTDEQLKEELKGLSKDISKGMGKVHKGLEKAALPRRKADELRSEFNRMLNKLRKGEADELHGGMKEYLDANPAKLAELLKINKEDAKSLLEDDSKLLKRLAENAEKTSDLFKDVDTLNDVLKRQADLEKSMEEVRKSMERGRATEGSIERVLDILQESERRKKPWGGGSWDGSKGAGQPQPGEQPGEEEGEGEGDKPSAKPGPGSAKPSGGLENSGGDSAGGTKPGEIEEREPSGDVMKANLQGKDAKKATAKESKRKINPRYDGMKRVFDKLRKRRNG